jgi:hypothetical protein
MLRLAALFLLQQFLGFATDLVFSGTLIRVGPESISIQLADRRVIDAKLPNTRLLTAGALTSKYEMGDQVEIACKTIEPYWEEDASRFQYLELAKLRFLRQATVGELSSLSLISIGREAPNLLTMPKAAVPALKPPEPPRMNAEASEKLNHAREVNLEYVAHMPNFVADESAKRYVSDGKQWRDLDTIETEITFKGFRAVRREIRRNGKSWDQPFDALPAFKWYGGFGTEIRPLFDPECPTTIEYEGHVEVRGKQLLKYRYSSPPGGCFGPFHYEYQRYNPQRDGHVFLDDPGGNVIQLDEDATGFPSQFDLAKRHEEVSWDYVKIGDASHLLPVAATFLISYSSGKQTRVEVVYKNHRHFEASTNVTFH